MITYEIKDSQLWLKEGNVFKTAGLKIGQTYVAPQNDQVTVTFTKLPENAGNFTEKKIDFRVGPGTGSSESSTGGSVLGATTNITTNGTAPFITQTSTEEDEATATSNKGTDTTNNQPEGAVLGTTTCN